MIEYAILKFLWWMIIGLVLVLYATTAGFDLGVTMLMPFFRKETDRRILLNTSAPTWDGNQTWLVFAGGGLFVVWPAVYSTAFSGMYAAMLFILWPFCLRPPGYDYRSKIDSHIWRRIWDVALFISSFCPVFIFGLILGNCFIGFPFHFDPVTMREYWDGNFWDLFNGFSILCGFVSVVMIAMHGSAYMQRRTENNLRKRARVLQFIFAIILLILFSITGYLLLTSVNGYSLVSQSAKPATYVLDNVVVQARGAWIASFYHFPWKFYPAVFVYFAIILSLVASAMKAYTTAFWMSAIGVASVVATAGCCLFPFIMPSLTHPNQSLTLWNSASSHYALNTMLYVGVVLLFIICAYKIFTYHHLWHPHGTITEKDLRENEHTFY